MLSGGNKQSALLFLSGVAALIYQVVWIKQLSLVVGVDVYAVTSGISAFFLGLGVGSYLFGRQADASARPFRLYAFLELGSGVLGIAATVALGHSGRLFALLEARAGILAWIVPAGLVGVPAIAMGGTLPVLIRSVKPQGNAIATLGGRLYASNTAGAILGALLPPFLLLPTLGVTATAFAAGAINLAAAVFALMLDRSETACELVSTPPQRPALLLYAAAGGIALGYEVFWSQAIVQFLSTRSFAFAIVLATYLAGLFLGSFLYARVADHVRHSWGFFGFLIAGAGFLAVFEIAILGNWLMQLQSAVEQAVRALTGSETTAMCGRFVIASGSIVFAPTVLLGAAFPAALRIAARPESCGRDTGRVIGFNTFGGIAGTLLTGFVLVPALGLIGALGILALGAAAIGLLSVMRDRGVRIAVMGTAAATVLVLIVMPRDQLARLLARTRSGGDLVFYAESPGGTVAVLEQSQGTHAFRRLYIQGVSNSGDAMTSLRYMRLQALLPLIIHNGEPRSALVIGMGTGITAGALTKYPDLRRQVVAELLPAVVRAAPLFQGNFAAGSVDSRLDIRLRDGRRELLQNPEEYDVITLEPPPPSAAGVVNLYSSDFYKLARSRLRPGGILAQWWPLPTQNDEDSRSLVRSFLDSFPYVSLWTTEIHEMLLVGSNQPIELNVASMTARFNLPGVREALGEVGISSLPALLAAWITGRPGLEQYVGDAPAVTDDRPRIEYATWVRRGEFVRVLPRVLALRGEPPLIGADESFRAQLARERTNLLGFYEAALYAYKGERSLWARKLEPVMKDDGANPYYRWMVGDSQ
jgi:spermidine synthase